MSAELEAARDALTAWDDGGRIFPSHLAAALRALLAEHERLTDMHSGETHPGAVYSPEVFEQMIGYLQAANGNPMTALRLAVSERLTTQPTDDEREAHKEARAALYDYRHPERGKPGVDRHRAMRALAALLEEEDRKATPTDEALWDFANDLLDAWNIEDDNPPSLVEDFRNRFTARFRRQEPITDDEREAIDDAVAEFLGGTLTDAVTDALVDDIVRALEAARAER